MALLSKSSTYALRAILHMMMQGEDRYVSIGRLSDDLSISFHFLTKILQRLTQAGLLKSSRGPQGGVMLAKPPATISALDIVEAVEGPRFLKTCVLGLTGCSDSSPCPMHTKWKHERKRIRDMLAKTSLKSLATSTESQALRLHND